MPRDTRQLIRRVGAALPAVALIGGGAALASTGSGEAPRVPVAEARPQVTVPATALRRADAPVLPALPPVPSEMAEALPAAFSPAGSSQDPASGVPVRALEAYRHAAALVDAADPACNVDWALVAAIGKVESNHGRYAGNGIDDSGTVRPGIYGLPLNGRNDTATIPDSDGGALDRDAQWDRAVGPMQFIPTTWAVVGVDGDGNGAEDPQNITDAATATAVYLCSGPGDLTQPSDLRSAVLRYNQSDAYVQQVVTIADSYRRGVTVMPSEALTPGQLRGAPYLPSGQEQAASARPDTAASGSQHASAGTAPSGSTGSGSAAGSGSGAGSGGSGAGSGSGNEDGEPAPQPEPTQGGVVADVTGTVTDAVESVTKPLTGSTPAPTRPTQPATPAPTPTPTPTCLVLGVVKVGDVCL